MSWKWYWRNSETWEKWNTLKWYYKMIIIVLEVVVVMWFFFD